MDGNPIWGANITSQNNSTTSAPDGWFEMTSENTPQWITVKSDGFISRTRAGAPGLPVLFRLTPDDGKTTVIHFAGDTMFGRRFFDPNEDDDISDGLLSTTPDVQSHFKLLEPVKPLLENADFTVVNFETTLSEQAYFPVREPRPLRFHATAEYVYASHPNSVMALKQAGVDIVGIGNNHNYDMFEEGLNTSLSTLDQVGMLHFGAGKNEAGAWAPTIITSKGQTIAFMGCTTVSLPSASITKTDVRYVALDAQKKGGAAYCSDSRIRSEIAKVRPQVDMVVFMVHGGKEYQRTPTDRIRRLTQIAREAGAALVINHHPHVVGGFSAGDQSLVAWTIGNFLFDQTVWPSFETYMLAVYLREGKVIRAYAEPLIIDGYLPHGLTGELADFVARGAAGREPGPFIVESGAMEVDFGGHAIQNSYTQTIDSSSELGQVIAVPPSQWISDFKGTGKLRLGRDLLWIGGFENDEVDATSRVAPLWDLVSGEVQIGQDYAYEGETGIRLTRGSSNIKDVVTTNLHRLRVDPGIKLSVTGMIRASRGATAFLQISWYPDTLGPSFGQTTEPIAVESYDQWQSFHFDAEVPAGAVAVQVFLRLTPPVQGNVTADFDNIRVIEWASENAAYSLMYDHALLTGSGELTFTQQILPGAEQWFTAPLSEQNR
jgi:poly-gamma-glutamate synthesis protein (capsule biosynthesis protein)